MLGLSLLILALATARGTRLIVEDYITEPFRTRVQRKFGDESKVTYLVNCRFCASIWVGFIAALCGCLLIPEVGWWWLGPLTLAFSSFAIWWCRLEDGDT